MTYFQETKTTLKSGLVLDVIFTDADHACVRTANNEGEVVNGVPISLILHFYRPVGSAPWKIKPGEVLRTSITRADRWNLEASPSARTKVLEKVVPEIGALVAAIASGSTIAQEAEVEECKREVRRAEAKVLAAEKAMGEAKAEHKAAVARLRKAMSLVNA